ncbi:MAG TPA: hypothetical protein VGF37_05130, partial [Chthoniobacterales bacterium]
LCLLGERAALELALPVKRNARRWAGLPRVKRDALFTPRAMRDALFTALVGTPRLLRALRQQSVRIHTPTFPVHGRNIRHIGPGYLTRKVQVLSAHCSTI